MSDSRGLSVVMPAYNEEEAIADVIRRLREALGRIPGLAFEIIVVDDCSTDRTAERVPAGDALLLRHPKNFGYGRSILTGIDRAQHEMIAIIDADNTYDPEELARMVPLMEFHDMVIGARDIRHQSVLMMFLRAFLKGIIWFFTGTWSPDPNSGMRLFIRDTVTRGRSLFSQKFSFSTSLTFFATLNNQFIEYVPIAYHKRSGFSKVHPIRDSFRTFQLISGMALVYRPVKCFLVLVAAFLLGVLGLFAGQGLLGPAALLPLLMVWITFCLLVGMTFLGFILSLTHERQPPRQK